MASYHPITPDTANTILRRTPLPALSETSEAEAEETGATTADTAGDEAAGSVILPVWK
jgi:hypothetical protein